MSLKPYYAQRCPCCQKFSSFEVELLGFEVCCQHCGHTHQARDDEQQSAAVEDPMNFWINFTSHDFEPTRSQDNSYQRHPK